MKYLALKHSGKASFTLDIISHDIKEIRVNHYKAQRPESHGRKRHRLDMDDTGSHPCYTGIPGFSNVATIVTNLMNDGMVDTVYNETSSKPKYRVSEQGHQLLGQIGKVINPSDIP